jgi:hypothetical protein
MMPGGGGRLPPGGFLGGALGAALQAAAQGHLRPRGFSEQYHCYSVAYADKAHLEVRRAQDMHVFSLIPHLIWLLSLL